MRYLLMLVGAFAIFIVFVTAFPSFKETNDIYLIPEGYKGNIHVLFNVPNAPELQTEGEYDVYPINSEGYFVTSKEDMDYGTITDKYFYVDSKGNRTPIASNCIEYVSNGASEQILENGDKLPEIRYTHSILKNSCNEEPATSYESSISTIIEKVKKEFY